MIKIGSFIWLVLLCLVGSVVCSAKAPAKNSISGQVKNLPGGSMQLVLEEDINRKKGGVIAVIPVDANGRFKFQKQLSPNIYSLKISTGRSIMLAIDKGQHIVINGDAAGYLKITGSEDTRKLEAYESFRKESLNRLVIVVRNQIKELKRNGAQDNDPKLLELTQLEAANYDLHRDELIEFVKREMGTSLAIYPTSIRWGGEKNIPFLLELARRFEKAHPRTAIAAKVSEKVRVLAANRIGGKVAEISTPGKDGKPVPLSSVKAKYILIDFWASWCGPCRRESALLVELYNQFKNEGFEIYGVGLESANEPWLKAIEKDKRTWINVVSFQQFEAPVAFDFAVTSLPANVLIDASGKVIARNLHGSELKELVGRLFVGEK